jgi:hypothetical protein
MRKTLLLTVAAAIFLFSCKKEHSASTIPSGKKYKVDFNVSNLSQQRASFSLKPKALSIKRHNLADSVVALEGSSIDVLYYYVFDPSQPGEPTIHRITQDSTSCDQFGMITDSLPAGHYIIAIVAGKKGLISQNGGDAQHTLAGYGSLNWQDTFFYQAQIEVPATSAIYDVTLHRIVGKLELQLLDSIPAEAKTIKMAVYREFSALNMSFQQIGDGIVDTGFTFKTIPVSAIGKPGFTVDRIQGATAFYLDVYITAFDASNHVLANVKVTGVKCNPNEKTVLSGKLFGTVNIENSQTFQVKVDTAWDSTPLRQSFSLRKK